jgi:hypothetical protein
MSARIRLHRIEGHPVTLHFSPGYRERAERLGLLVAAAHEFLERWLDVSAHTTLSVLRRENWRHLRRAPYGYPHSIPERGMIFAPAHYPPRLIERARVLYEAAPPKLRETVSGSVDELNAQIMRFYDLVAIHELGHLFVEHLQLALGTQWLTELVANFFATAFFHEERPDLAACWMAWADVQASTLVRHRALEDYEAHYTMLDFTNASYYQGRFNQCALALWKAQGRELAPALVSAFSRRHDAVITRFRQVAPEFDW